MSTRVSSLLAVASLAACAMSPATDGEASQLAWRDVQRERLARLYQPRDGAATLQALRAQEPGRRQSPVRHLDQLEPVGVGQRRFQGSSTPVALRLDAGPGTVSVKVPGAVVKDRADAVAMRLLLDTAANSARGASLQLRAIVSDDDLFAGSHISSGVAPAAAAAELRAFEVFPHLRFDTLAADGFVMPVRVGLLADWLDVDHRAAAVERSWVSLGPRVVAEPRWVLLGDPQHHLDVFGRMGTELGVAWFEEEFQGGQDQDLTARWAWTAGVGLRYAFGQMHADLGYEFERTWYGAVDTELLGDRSSTTVEHQQLFFGFGVRF